MGFGESRVGRLRAKVLTEQADAKIPAVARKRITLYRPIQFPGCTHLRAQPKREIGPYSSRRSPRLRDPW